jgi:hypothetical protein
VSLLTIHLRQLLLSLGLLLVTTLSTATTIEQMRFEQVVDTAALIFQGEVLAVESRQTGPRSISTYVRFRVDEVVKGSYASDTIELSFLGGRVGNLQMTVSEMQVPQVGETGIYFVQTLDHTQVHPLVGWTQGHYLIDGDDSAARVTTAEGQPVTALNPGNQTPLIVLPHEGTARGVQIQGLSDSSIPMTPDAFKSRIRQIAEQGQGETP